MRLSVGEPSVGQGNFPVSLLLFRRSRRGSPVNQWIQFYTNHLIPAISAGLLTRGRCGTYLDVAFLFRGKAKRINHRNTTSMPSAATIRPAVSKAPGPPAATMKTIPTRDIPNPTLTITGVGFILRRYTFPFSSTDRLNSICLCPSPKTTARNVRSRLDSVTMPVVPSHLSWTTKNPECRGLVQL